MKLSTKIIIGLIVLTALASFFTPQIIGWIAKSRIETSRVDCGPVKTIVINANVDRSRGVYSEFRCRIHNDGDNYVSFQSSWPKRGDLGVIYNPEDSTLTVDCSMNDWMGKIEIGIGNELTRLVANGDIYAITLDDLELPVLVVDNENASVYVSGGEIGSLICNMKRNDAVISIEDDTEVDTLFYSIQAKHAISGIENIPAKIALPGSKYKIGDSNDDEINVAIEDETEAVD